MSAATKSGTSSTGFQPVGSSGTGFQPVGLSGTGFQPVVSKSITGILPVLLPPPPRESQPGSPCHSPLRALLRDRLRAPLRDRLLALGFDVVRFARITPDALAQPAAALRAWLDAGHHAGMAWLERGFEKRKNPALALPSAASVILLGVNYNPAEDDILECGGRAKRRHRFEQHAPAPSAPTENRASPKAVSPDAGAPPATAAALPKNAPPAKPPHFARFARYSDYHDTIKPALARAGRVLEEQLGITADDYRYYVDTGPVLERAWAERAGAGFIGKNAMLISRDYGNWLFLAAIFVRAEIPPDAPFAETPARARSAARHRLCGKCSRCLEACPTGALVGAGVVDSRLCVAYQTIENKGVIPRELREKIGAHVFGCDVCAEVCPWNRFAQKTRGLLLDARPGLARLSLRDILGLTPEKFAAQFRGTAIKRIKLAGLLRNASVVAGNLGARDCLGQLVALACHAPPLARVHAVWAVFKIAGAERAAELLREARASETDADVLREYAYASAARRE